MSQYHLRGCLPYVVCGVLAASAGSSSGRTVSARASEAVSVAFLVVHAFASEDVEAVDEVEHAVAVDAVVFRVPTHRGGDGAADVALIAQDVKHLEGDGGGVALEEVLGQLCVPDKLVGVHACAAVAPSAAVVDVGAQLHVPREAHGGLAAVGEVVGVHVVARLQLVVHVLVGDGAVECEVVPVGAVVEAHAFAEREGLGDVFHRLVVLQEE